MIFGTFNHPGFIIDRRLENAESLRNYIFEETRGEVEKDLEKLEAARENIHETEAKAVKDALFAFKDNNSRQQLRR